MRGTRGAAVSSSAAPGRPPAPAAARREARAGTPAGAGAGARSAGAGAAPPPWVSGAARASGARCAAGRTARRRIGLVAAVWMGGPAPRAPAAGRDRRLRAAAGMAAHLCALCGARNAGRGPRAHTASGGRAAWCSSPRTSARRRVAGPHREALVETAPAPVSVRDGATASGGATAHDAAAAAAAGKKFIEAGQPGRWSVVFGIFLSFVLWCAPRRARARARPPFRGAGPPR